MSAAQKPRRGRPPGSPNVKTTCDVEPSVCPTCKSTQRTAYVEVTRHHIKGFTPAGNEYNLIIRYRTTCKDCTQTRIDRIFDFIPPRHVNGTENEDL